VVEDIRRNVGYFTPDPHLRLGDADSAHGVLFGEMHGEGDVAVKPHASETRAHAERLALEKVASMGFETLNPMRVATGGLAAYLITARRSGIRHLAQMNWNVNVAQRDELESMIIPTLSRAASAMAQWHSAGIFHGDPQAKNVAFGPDGVPIFVDAEKAQ